MILGQTDGKAKMAEGSPVFVGVHETEVERAAEQIGGAGPVAAKEATALDTVTVAHTGGRQEDSTGGLEFLPVGIVGIVEDEDGVGVGVGESMTHFAKRPCIGEKEHAGNAVDLCGTTQAGSIGALVDDIVPLFV